MVKFYTTNYTYDFPLPAVSLAYFLRYPNPYSKHVVSSDVIERTFDPVTQRLSTTRLHLKRSKLPTAVTRLLPRSLLGAKGKEGESQSFILETSTVDVKEGWMKTESRNLEWRGVLSVVERQTYTAASAAADATTPTSATAGTTTTTSSSSPSSATEAARRSLILDGRTSVETTVTLRSPLGEQRWKQRRLAPPDPSTNLPSSQTTTSSASFEDEAPPKIGFLRRWGQESLQRSIEAIGLRRTEKSQPNAKEGMQVVLERFRQGGLVAILEGMRRDRPDFFAGAADGSWRRGKGSEEGDWDDV